MAVKSMGVLRDSVRKMKELTMKTERERHWLVKADRI
jgi:hypothetical protein